MYRKLYADLFALIAVVAAGCSSSSGPLSPARNLVGTWKTTFPVTVYFDDDWCTSTPSLVASQDWDATWVITSGADDNTVDIKMTFSVANFQNINGCPDTGVVPEVSPMFLTGNVSAATLTLTNGNTPAGVFDFTEDNLQGDLDYTWCEGDCQREYSTKRTFILSR